MRPVRAAGSRHRLPRLTDGREKTCRFFAAGGRIYRTYAEDRHCMRFLLPAIALSLAVCASPASAQRAKSRAKLSSRGETYRALPDLRGGSAVGTVAVPKAKPSVVETQLVMGRVGVVRAASVTLRRGRQPGDKPLAVATQDTNLVVLMEKEGYAGCLMQDNTLGWVDSGAVEMLDYRVQVKLHKAVAAEIPQMVSQPQEAEAAPEPETQSSGDARADAVVREAFTYIGVPYVWAGNTRNGLDCSAFVKNVFAKTRNLGLPRHSGDQARVGAPVNSTDDLAPGDRLYFDMGRKGAGVAHRYLPRQRLFYSRFVQPALRRRGQTRVRQLLEMPCRGAARSVGRAWVFGSYILVLFQKRLELRVKLVNLRRDHILAVRLLRVVRVVVEVVIFGAVKVFVRRYRGHNRCVPNLLLREGRYHPFGGFFLFRRLVIDHRPILRANVVALPVFRGRIPQCQQHFDKRAVRNDRRIECNSQCLGVTGFAGFHRLVTRLDDRTARVTRLDFLYAFEFFEYCFHAPEASGGNYRLLGFRRGECHGRGCYNSH